MKKLRFLIFALLFICLIGILVACNVETEIRTNAVYDINLSYDGNLTVEGVQNVCYTNNLAQPLDSLKIMLYANAYKQNAFTITDAGEAYYDGISYGNIEIDEFTVNGNETEFSLSDNEQVLSVDIPSTASGEKVDFSIKYTVTLPKCNGRLGVTQKTVNLCSLYPVVCPIVNGKFVETEYSPYGDPYVADVQDFFVTLTAPDGYVLACSGKITDETQTDGKKTFEITAKNTRDFAMVLSQSFALLAKTADGVEIKYLYYDDSQPAETLGIAQNAFKIFSNAFGKYPYDTYTVVQAPFVAMGMEYSSLSIIADNLPQDYLETTVVHETAHQWWYETVGTLQTSEAFVDEGLAEFSTAYYFKANGDKEKYADLYGSHKLSYAVYKAYAKANGITFDETMAKPLSDFNSSNEYVVIAYDKGALMFGWVFDVLGEKKFKKAMRNFYEKYKFKIAVFSDLTECFKKYNKGLNLNPWLNGKTVI